MHQTICQRCGAANRADAIVCTECGTKLAHREQNAVSKIKNSALGKSVATAPRRLVKWTFKRLIALLAALLSLAAIGICCLCFLLFTPFTWDRYPKPAGTSENDDENRQQLHLLLTTGGTFSSDVASLRQLGNELIFNPPGKKHQQVKKKARQGEKYFSMIKLPNDRFGMVLYQKFNNKLPFRVLVVFAARRSQNGQLELESCRLGNLPVSPGILRKVAERLLTEWNPNQQFLTAFDRISQAEMEIERDGKDNKLRIYIQSTRN